jgi:hypothetical protein
MFEQKIQEVQYRSIQRVGQRGYCISIPKKYVKQLGLEAHQLMKFSLEDKRKIVMEGISV